MSAQTATAASAPSSLILLREDRGGIAVLTLNRPQARNSLSEALLEALGDTLSAIAHDRAVRALVLAAVGPAFSAGHDLKELNAHRSEDDRGRAYFKRIMGLCSRVMQQIVRLPQPVIASVHATATAAGCQLVASCDLAIASQAAKFATPGVNIGLFCSTPMVALSRNVSRKIAAKSTHVVKIGKEAFYRQAEMDLAAAYLYASNVMVENMLARDAEEGITAFVEKRPPT